MDLESINTCQQVIVDLLSPDAVLDSRGRERLAVLLGILNGLSADAIQQQPPPVNCPHHQICVIKQSSA